MVTRDMKVHAEKKLWDRGIEIYLYERLPDGKVSSLSNLEFTTIDPMKESGDGKSITLSYETAQKLMDELWNCGLRPSEGSGSAGSLAATQNHLKNIQEISNRLLILVERRDIRREE